MTRGEWKQVKSINDDNRPTEVFGGEVVPTSEN